MKTMANDSLFSLIHDFLKIYLPKQRKVSPNTIRSYRKAIEDLLDYVKKKNEIPLASVTLEMLTPDEIFSFLVYIEEECKCSTSTRNSRFAGIRTFLHYAADRDITLVPVLTTVQKIPLKKPDNANVVDYLSMDAITAIVEKADDKHPKGLRDRTIMIVMYDTGARVQEVVDIDIADLKMEKLPKIILHGKGNKIRTVPLMEKTVKYLKKYLSIFHEDSSGNQYLPLFYSVIKGEKNRLSDRLIRHMVCKYGTQARETCPEVPEKIHPHLFRHSRAMHLYQEGMDLTLISQWLGHVNLETTQIYAHADTEHKRKAIAAATPHDNPLYAHLDSERYTIDDEELLKRLVGLR